MSIKFKLLMCTMIMISIFIIFIIININNNKMHTNNELQYESELCGLSAEQMIKVNIQSMNEHNDIRYYLTYLPDRRAEQDYLDNIQYWNLLSIKEIDVDDDYKKTYINVYNIKRFSTKYEIKWKNEKRAPYKNGKYTWTYTVIKPTENDRWYIATCGF